MGKARAGTESNARKRYDVRVTYHALESLRDRLNELGSSSRFSAEPDSSLELRIAEAVDRGPHVHYLCDGTEHSCVDLSESFETDLHAFVRDRKVLSVLTGAQVRRSIDGHRWTQKRAA